MLFLLGTLIALFGLIIYRLTSLMLFPEEARLGSAKRTRTFFDIIPAKRGNIYDCHGVALAITVPILEIGIDPQLLRANEEKMVMEFLGKKLSIPSELLLRKWEERMKKSPHGRWISMGETASESIYQNIIRAKLPGVYGRRKFQRIYPQAHGACHVVGFLNGEGVACCGVERFADFFLRGQDGWIVSEKDGRRQELVQHRSRNVPPMDGSDVYLNLDMNIQRIVERELEYIRANFHPNFSVIIVTEAESGKLVAMACFPNYDPNHYGKFPLDHMRNRAVADIYEPGSVFKIVPSSAALEEGIVQEHSTFDCSMDSYEYAGEKYSLPRDHSSFEVLTLREVLRQSSNRGSAQIAIRLGRDRFYSYVRAFGFGEKSGYGFDGDLSGILRPPHLWDGLTITRMPMGHAIGVTPMQMHMAMGVLASEGYLFTPLVLDKIIPPRENLLKNGDILRKPIIRRQVLSRRTVERIRSIIGSGEIGTKPSLSLAYKTGTAQKIVDGKYVHNQHIASCSGFFPTQNPKYVITVVVDSPQCDGGTAWGSRYAQPSFQRIATELFRQLYAN
ncbi:MAG: penicillin-binding protein 2 [Puniceicoccales bacterium]|nr:penicillin-binding protein 2 [Puniceicoccales bacterium]